MARFRASLLFFTLVLSTQTARSGFPDSDLVIPAVSRAPGNFLSQWYSQIWITNPGSQQVTFQASFYQRDQANPTPHTFSDTVNPAETKRYDNVVETLFGLSGVSGAVRVTASGPILVSSRTYNLPSSGNAWDSQGQFFTGIPVTFAIGPGETSQLQGISYGWSENFRYNFGLVNIDAGTVTVHVAIRDHSGVTLGEKDYTLLAFEALQYSVNDIVGGLVTNNAILLATVTAGAGRVFLYGTQIANGSQDSSGFEMSFKNSLLWGSAGVTSLNGLTGAVSLGAGSGVAVTPSGNTLTISALLPPGGSLPAGSAGQTLRSDGSSWLANSLLYNNGSAVGINTTSPGATLDVNGTLRLPFTTSSHNGVLLMGPTWFLHAYGPLDDSRNTFVGANSGNFTMGGGQTLGTQNTAVGTNTLDANTSGWGNTAIGSDSLTANTTGPGNTALGSSSMRENTIGGPNTAVGFASLGHNTTAGANTAVGVDALYTQSFSNGGLDWASHNTAVGFLALTNNQPTSTTSGIRNTALGSTALVSNTIGSYDTAVGSEAGSSTDTISAYGSGTVTLVANTTGSYNTFLGRRTGATKQVSNCTAVGVDAYCTDDNQVRLGNRWVSSIAGNVGFSALSDIRAKSGVRDVPLGLNFVMALRPVEYRLRGGNGRIDMGFVAQDVEALLGEGYNVLDIGADPDRTLSLRHSDLIAPLVKAVQEQQVTIEAQKTEIDALNARLREMDARISRVEAGFASR